MDFRELRSVFANEIAAAKTSNDVEELRIKYLGKSGVLTEAMKQIGSLPPESKKEFGATVNSVKTEFSAQIDELKTKFSDLELEQKLKSESIDITLNPRSYAQGKIHPLSETITTITKIMTSLGFEFQEGQDIEDEWHNFTGLNMDENHPARQMQDTFYVKDMPSTVLRTHTSNLQIRYMEKNKPPFKIFTYGKTYRSDYDATHTPMFHQMEAFYIDKAVNISHLKGFIETFLKSFFEVENAPVRLRPSYFPFTEPSLEVDVKCDRSNKEQLKIGEGNDWLEILGCGMIHPNVLKNCGIDPNEYQGFALGCGLERLSMLKYNISDLRKFFETDIRWLKHYGF